MLALDASGLKQHNRVEWTRARWKVRRGFVKMHVLVDTDTMKILAPGVTDDSVGDSAMFESLLGQVADAGGGNTEDGARHA
ncbi:MAG: transposase [Thaumarchaeota archaeon]|nr:transposase [Nitrososphaerota archaeon]